MTVSPACLVKNGAGSFGTTANGVDVTAGATISIKLADTTDVSAWFLQPLGTDELSTAPVLTGVSSMTYQAVSPSTVVTFTYPNALGRALRFQSTTNGVGGPLQTTFTIYTRTTPNNRVGALGEQREGNTSFGWITLLNPILRSGASVLFYDDTQQTPTLGASSIQAAIDALKAGAGNALPPLSDVQFSVLMEDPGGTLVFERLTQDMILPGFSVSSFGKTAPSGGTVTYRRGDTVSGITASASYVGGPPNSASIANVFGGSTDGGDTDPGSWVITSPFATASLGGVIKRSGADLAADPTMTATLTAVKGVSRTGAFTIVWTRDVYWDVGVAGLSTSSDILALSNTVLSGTRNRTLTLSPSSQKVYYAYPKEYGTATFILSGFPAAFNAPSEVAVTNTNGVTSTYYLYESTNLLTGSSLPFVVT